MIPILNITNYKEEDQKFIKYLILGVVLTAIEISIIVFIPEEGGKLFPSKICFRYLAVFVIPYILMFLKNDNKHLKLNMAIYITYIIVGIYVLVYHVYANRSISVIDGYVLVVLEVLDLLWRPSSTIIIFIMTIITILIIDLNRRGKINNLVKVYMKIFVIGLLLILPINLMIPIYSSNVVRSGTETEADYIKLAKFINLDYDKVYAYNLPDYNFFGQVISDYKKIEKNESVEIDIKDEKVCVILFKSFTGTVVGATKVDIGTKYMDVYVSDEKAEKLQINLSY